MKPTQTQICLKRLALSCSVGVPRGERRQLQTILMDVTCTLQNAKLAGDTMSASVNYAMIIHTIQRIIDDQSCALLETLCERVAAAIFEDSRIQKVQIRCEKPFKFSHCESVGVERIFER